MAADANPNRAAAKIEEQVKREQMKQEHLKVSAIVQDRRLTRVISYRK
jgi:hypothetical protein